MAEIDVLKAQIVRQDLNTPWGFVLQGGADQGTPLKIKSLVRGSPAARIGLKPGDEVTEIGELQTEGLAYQQVQDLIDKHGDTLILTVERRARGSVPANPVINATETEPVKDYQPYDMTGAQQHPQAATTNDAQPGSENAAAGSGANQAGTVDETAKKNEPTAEENPSTDTKQDGQPAQQSTTAAPSAAATAEAAPAAEPAKPVEPAPAASNAPAAETGAGDAQKPAAEPATSQTTAPTTEGAPQSQVYVQESSTPAGTTQLSINVHQEAPAPPQRRRRVRTRPVEGAAVPAPTGSVSQIVQGTPDSAYYQPTGPILGPDYTPSGQRPDTEPVALLRGSGQQPMPDVGTVLVSGVRRRQPEPEPVKSYQPYDLSGPRYYQPVQTQPQVYQFQTVRARPFEDKRRPYYQVQEQQSPPPPLVLPQQPAPPQPQYVAPAPTQQYSPRGYDYQDYQRPARSEESHLTQSRTFKVLESLMSCEVDPTLTSPPTPTDLLLVTAVDPSIPDIAPASPAPSKPYPWRRRHTVADIVQHSKHDKPAPRETVALHSKSSNESENIIRNLLPPSQTYRIVYGTDMDKQDDPEQSRRSKFAQRRGSLDAGSGSRPWFYRKYSNKLLSKSVDAADEDEVFDSSALRLSRKQLVGWDYDDIQMEVERFVERCKQEQPEGEDPDREEEQEEAPGLDRDPEEDRSRSDEANPTPADSGYLTPMSMSEDVEPTGDTDPTHCRLKDLPIRAVNSEEYPELTGNKADFVIYTSEAKIELKPTTKKDKESVTPKLIVLPEPAAGVAGLPPQRTLSQERWKAEQDAKRGSPRVKVFMPQQYNSPLGMYSAQNVVETFQAQAETVMDAMERHSAEKYPISEVQRAVMEN